MDPVDREVVTDQVSNSTTTITAYGCSSDSIKEHEPVVIGSITRTYTKFGSRLET